MENKSFQLVAWTEKGKVKMVPSLLEEVSESYRESIRRTEKFYEGPASGEIERILAHSRSLELYGNMLLRSDFIVEAFRQYVKAADVCLGGSDSLWYQHDSGYTTAPELRARFRTLYALCEELTEKYPFLKKMMESGPLPEDREMLY